MGCIWGALHFSNRGYLLSLVHASSEPGTAARNMHRLSALVELTVSSGEMQLPHSAGARRALPAPKEEENLVLWEDHGEMCVDCKWKPTGEEVSGLWV